MITRPGTRHKRRPDGLWGIRTIAAFNAQNAISLPALQAACGLAAQRRADAHQVYHDRVVELDQQCRDGLSGLQP